MRPVSVDTHQTVKVLTSEIGVSMTRLSPYFFHRPLLTCVTTNSMQEVFVLYCMNVVNKYSGDENVALKCLKKQASTDLVGSIVLGHLLSQQEHTLVPLQLLIHRLVESIADSDLTKKMGKIITP